MMKKLSTTAIAKQLGLSAKEAFDRLLEDGLVVRVDDQWQLTDEGFSRALAIVEVNISIPKSMVSILFGLNLG